MTAKKALAADFAFAQITRRMERIASQRAVAEKAGDKDLLAACDLRILKLNADIEAIEQGDAAALQLAENEYRSLNKRVHQAERNNAVHRRRTPATVPLDEPERANANPPTLFWVELLLPQELSADLVIALEDAFPRWIIRYGERKAKWIFRAQTLGVIASFHWSKIRAVTLALAGKFGLDLIKGLFTPR